MKKNILAIVLCTLIATIGMAQTKSINTLTQEYFQIKTALANDDANTASSSAALFAKNVTNISMKDISPKLHPTFMQYQKSLSDNSQTIANSKDIKVQRKSFVELSKSMIALAKADKISNSTIYEDYYPMKKASWLSEIKEISNPFYGSSMATCGKVTATY